jgi:translocator protein
MKLNYFIIPLVAIIVAICGSVITTSGMQWYANIKLPSWTPPGFIIGLVWTFLYVLATFSALIIWNRRRCDYRWLWTMIIFAINAVLNIFWSYLFFYKNVFYISIWEAGILGLSVLILIVLIWPRSKLSASLLVPYFLWVSFATYLNYSIWLLNK